MFDLADLPKNSELRLAHYDPPRDVRLSEHEPPVSTSWCCYLYALSTCVHCKEIHQVAPFCEGVGSTASEAITNAINQWVSWFANR